MDCVLRVGNSVNGVVYTVRLASNDLAVDELRDELVRLSDIPSNDQILLSGPPYARLDPRRAISSYGLPASDRQIYLYDRRMLSQEHPVPPRLALEPVEIELPTVPVLSSENQQMLNESSYPLLKALLEYESHFQLQVNQSEAIERASAANVAACERSVKELEVQSNAIRAAIANVEVFRESMSKHFLPFWNEYEEVASQHEKLLAQFETHLAALSTVTLHPALATGDRKTLYDCVPVEREREWAYQCEHSHLHLRTQVARLKQVHEEVSNDVSTLVRSQDDILVSYQGAVRDLSQMQQYVTAQRDITGKLEETLGVVVRKIAEASSEMPSGSSMFASTLFLDMCRGIDELYHSQHDLLPSAQKSAEEIKATMSKMSSIKLSFFSHVHSHLRRISVAQSKIRDFENSLAMLKEALHAQKKHFNELEHLAKLPESYTACLREIARRVRYGRQFSDRIQSMAEELAQMRDEEVNHRERFLRVYGQHLPRDFVPGLAEKPSHCEFRMRPFDQNLPPIEDESLDDGNATSEEETKESDADTAGRSVCDPHTNNLETELLQKRCEELEARVAELTLELQQKKDSSYYESIVQSELSEVSAREGDSSCEFPLVLALAANAGGMTSSSEVDQSNLLERELQSLKSVKEEAESRNREKDEVIVKLESENQQFLINAAAFEEEIQERTRREQQLQEMQTKLQASLQNLQGSIDTQRASLLRVLKVLGFWPPRDREVTDTDEYITSHMERVETRIRELTSSADTEKVLRQELERQHEEINLLESQHFDLADSFKISFRSFHVNDLALFLPTSAPGSDAQRVYLAFHHGCPHRFLSEESISSFMIGGRKYPDYVVGRIVLIDEQLATESNNPYGLHLGTTFYILTVASLQDT